MLLRFEYDETEFKVFNKIFEILFEIIEFEFFENMKFQNENKVLKKMFFSRLNNPYFSTYFTSTHGTF